MPSSDDKDKLAAVRASYGNLPRRTRDVLYGKLTERAAVVAMLDEMSRKSAARMSADPAWGAPPIDRDPLLDHVIALIIGCAHVPESDRVAMPAGDGAALVGLNADERAHFARD